MTWDRDEATDEKLMTAVSKDDLVAFETLVKRHQNRVYRMACQMLSVEEDAWDVSQEIFIKIYNARHSYVENAKFTTWLYRIANNAVIDKIRQNQRRQKAISMDDVLSEPQSEEKSSYQWMALEQVKGKMSHALRELTERQRGMVILKYYEGCSVKEIAEVFDCATGTVKATLFQAVQRLREHLGKSGIASSEAAS